MATIASQFEISTDIYTDSSDIALRLSFYRFSEVEESDGAVEGEDRAVQDAGGRPLQKYCRERRTWWALAGAEAVQIKKSEE